MSFQCFDPLNGTFPAKKVSIATMPHSSLLSRSHWPPPARRPDSISTTKYFTLFLQNHIRGCGNLRCPLVYKCEYFLPFLSLNFCQSATMFFLLAQILKGQVGLLMSLGLETPGW